jgi:hypothetical protein
MTDSGGGSGGNARRREPGWLVRGELPAFQARSLRPQIPTIPFAGRAVAAMIGAEIRLWLGFGVMKVSALLRVMRPHDRAYARARLSSAKIEERYSLEQVIAQNRERKVGAEPTGKIELELPYDGDKFLTRQACADIQRSRARNPGRARVGYLTLAGYQDTDLDSVLGLTGSFGSMPIDPKLGPAAARGAVDELVADRTVCRMWCTYKPVMKLRDIYPLEINLDLRDPDTAGPVDGNEHADAQAEFSKIAQHVGFRPELLLRVTVRLHVPRDLADGAKVKVSEISVKWPTHPSPGLLAVAVAGEQWALRYNPVKASLQWFDVPMNAEQQAAGGDFVTFGSPPMVLSIPQPGDLYGTPNLSGRVCVTIDRLLSGTDARLFDATGRKERRIQPELKSVTDCGFTFSLDHAFSRRELTPRQQMHFDEVIPNEMRIDDIKNALVNLGYRVRGGPLRPTATATWWQLTASRSDGPERLTLDLVIEGRQYTARRQRQLPGGMTYQTDLESGEIRIYVQGKTRGDSQAVVHDVNALRRALDERFDRLPARR